MKTLYRYIAGRIFRGVLMAFIIVTGAIMLVDFVETSRNIGADEGLSAWTILLLTVLRAPQLIEQTIPFVILFGVMGALYGLNRRSELTVMRASGLSAWKFLLPAIGVTALIGAAWATTLNPLASAAMDKRASMITSFADQTIRIGNDKEIWLREGNEFAQTVIFAKRADMLDRTLHDVTFTVFEADISGDLVFARRLDAATAQLLPSNYWQLSDVIENSADAEMQNVTTMSVPTTITPEQIQERRGREGLPQFWKLPDSIKRMQQAGFSSTGLEIQFYRLLALPLMLVAMTVIAAGVSMHLTREGGTLKLMLSGGVLGFAVFFVDNIISAFGETGSISVSLAVWAIPIFVLCCGLTYLSVIEDG